MSATAGSLFSGGGGLDLAVEQLFPGIEIAWHAETDRHALEVYRRRWDSPNLGELSAVDWPQVPQVDVLVGGYPCFPAGTLVDTEDGYRPIETVRLGDRVRTHRRRLMPVTDLMRRQATDTVTVRAMGAPPFVTTAEHPFYVRTRSRQWNNERRGYDRIFADPEWVAAAELGPGHFIGTQIDDPDPSVPPLGAELAYLVGRWLGDGWVRSRDNYRWWNTFVCCSHAEADNLHEAIRAAGFTPQRINAGSTTKFRIGSMELHKMLADFGHGAAHKRIPGWVYRLPHDDQREIWRGWIDADGYIERGEQERGVTVSPELAHGMARIARNAHRRAASISRTRTPDSHVIEGRLVRQSDWYRVTLSRANREAFVEDGWCWAPVREVTHDAGDGEVYNLAVAEDESYTAWGFTVHNCQPWSTAGKRKGQDDDRDGWPWFRSAISALGPRLVLLENVRGHAVPAGAGRTVGDLSAFGYDAVWTTLRASDVGAPHRRDRWFCVAYPAGDGRPPRWAGPGQRAGCSGQLASNIGSAADTDGAGLHLLRGDPSGRRDADRRGRPWEGSWGDYEPAVRRWEAISGRYAPPPRDDQGRLNPPFVEWMMGWPEGHVAGLPRTAALRVLGNGVVPQQAVAAYSHLFAEVSS